MSGVVGPQGHAQADPGAPARRLPDEQQPTVQSRGAIGDGQAEARATLSPSHAAIDLVERLNDLVPLCGRYARPLVQHGELDLWMAGRAGDE
jgi:hypothetical protein